MKNLSLEMALHLQNNIFLLTLDDYSPHGIIGGLTTENWQFTVDSIYRCLKSGIWAIWNDGPLNGVRPEDKYAFLCEKLASLSPLDLNDEAGVYWLDVSICATDASRELISDSHIMEMSTRPCEPFIEEVEHRYVANGVSLSRGVLFPIRFP
ncbi:hypothetical protein GCM10009552_17390 [Rothia nasimurium]|uniref:Uncharacterized protein n=1 Tax=Luteibacter anthropi TaxID=564369 RepID=A0A7X5UBE3_9GAMM|nr:hypothetical protein [Luteibacter anthropi]NII07395.1 hypothetical protein [Luteibacter anthropi]